MEDGLVYLYYNKRGPLSQEYPVCHTIRGTHSVIRGLSFRGSLRGRLEQKVAKARTRPADGRQAESIAQSE